MLCSRSISLLLFTAASAAADTVVHITGTTRKSEGQVLELMGGRLEHVRKHDASPSRADDAAFLVTQVMKKDGYADVRVTWKIVSRNEIALNVEEGVRLEVGKVTVTGLPPEDAAKMEKLYARPARKDHPLSTDSAPYRKDDEEIGLGYIRQELNAQGYWDADAQITHREPNEGTGQINPTIEVRQGNRYTIGSPRITGSNNVGESSTRSVVQPFVGKVATTGNLNGMRLAVEQSFVSSGYPDAKISMGRALESPKFIPEFFIDVGKRVRLNKVHVDGLVRTNPKRIASRMSNLEGEWYDEAAMNKRIRGFLATGAFSGVQVEKTDVGEDRIDATLHFEEAKAKAFTLAAGVDSYQGFILRTTYADRNLFGQVIGFSSGFEFSTRGILGETKITDPWLLGSDVSGTARAYAMIFNREGYSSFETGLEAKTTWKFGDHYTLDLLAGYSIVNLTEDGLPSYALGETVYTNPRLRMTQSLDFRDSAVLPKSGWHFENPVEIGAAVGDLSTGYFKTGVTGGWYHKLNAKFDVGLGGEWGVIVPSGTGLDLPIDLRLFNGGSRSVRSFPERELGPEVDGYPVGGEASWSANAELIHNLAGSVKAVAFFDAGSLARDFDAVSNSEVELAAGLGVRLELPIGPVRLEYGYNLTRDVGEPIGTLHFAIGTAF